MPGITVERWGQSIMRHLFLLLGLMISLSSLGCAIPVGYGPCGGIPCDSCGDCDGGGYAGGPVLPYGPLDALRQAKRNLVCGGGGCGDVYYGEWRSYPPDCADPCCGDGFVGGAAPCVPGWAPGALLPRNIVPALYGKRVYQGDDACGCGSCGDCASGDCVSGGCSDCGSVGYDVDAPAVHSSGCNCGGNHVSSSQAMPPRAAASSMRSSPTMARTSATMPSRPATRTAARPSEQRTRTR